MTTRILLALCSSILSFCCLAQPSATTLPNSTNTSATQTKSTTTVPYVEASSIITTGNGPNLVPNIAPLTGAQEAALLRDLAQLPAFPNYPYSGCDDRAHALYLLLPKWQPNLAKAWIFSGNVLSPAFTNSIRYTAGNTAPTAWDFHVAVVYKQADSQQLMVLDLALSTVLHPQPIAEWLGHFDIPAGSFWTLLGGELYSFNKTESCNYSKHRQFFNGNLFAYDGDARKNHRIADNLARDAVGALALKQGADCSQLTALAQKPADLLTYLQSAGSTSANGICQQYLDAYKQALTDWGNRLN